MNKFEFEAKGYARYIIELGERMNMDPKEWLELQKKKDLQMRIFQ